MDLGDRFWCTISRGTWIGAAGVVHAAGPRWRQCGAC